MHTEEDFQLALDEEPEAHHLRLIFADWLEEQGDPRAAGYRALGLLRWVPFVADRSKRTWTWGNYSVDSEDRSELPQDWYYLTEKVSRNQGFSHKQWSQEETRREAENVVAAAFASLPQERQEELLSGSR